MKADMLRMLILSIQLSVTVMQSLPPIIRLNHSIGITDQKNIFAYIMNKGGQFSDDFTLPGLNLLIKTFIIAIKKYETPFGFQQRVLFISFWVKYV